MCVDVGASGHDLSLRGVVDAAAERSIDYRPPGT